MPAKRPVVSLRYGTALRRAFGEAAVFSAFVSDVLGEPVRVAGVRTELRGRGRVPVPMAIAGLGGDDEARALHVELWVLHELAYRERAERAHATAWADRAAAGRGVTTKRVATVVVVVPLQREPEPGERAARYFDELPAVSERVGEGGGRMVFVAPWATGGDVPARLRGWFELFVACDVGEVTEEAAGDAMTRRVLHAIERHAMSWAELEAGLDESLWEEELAKRFRAARRRGYREGLAENALAAMAERGCAVDAEVRAWAARAGVEELRRVVDALRSGGGGSA
ncbi:MAG: hypothetical protein U0324_36975 [Polyangiales bacterium]